MHRLDLQSILFAKSARNQVTLQVNTVMTISCHLPLLPLSQRRSLEDVKRKIIKERAKPNSTMMLYKSSLLQNKILTTSQQGMPCTLQKQAGPCSHPIKYPLQSVLCALNILGRRSWMMTMHVDKHYVHWCMTLITMMTIMAMSISNFTQIQSLSATTCPQVSQTNYKESFCPQHKYLYGLWLLDLGATDHSMLYMDDFLTFKKLQKLVKVCTAGKKCIFFTGIGTVIFTMIVNSKKQQICL